MTKKEFSPQEFFIGALSAVLTFFLIGWMAVFTVGSCGLLWMLGGTYWKPIRRFGVPFVIWLDVEFVRGWSPIDPWSITAFVLGVAILHIGDGFPDHRVLSWDPGSALGRFVERFFPDDRIGGPLTKWIIALIFQVSLLPYFVK